MSTLNACAMAALVVLAASSPAAADVKQSAADGFLVVSEVAVQASPQAVYGALGQIGRWWSSQHSWSGQAENLTLDLQAGGCFCERWGTASVEHGRVVFALPGELLRLRATLGPLQEMGLVGVLSFTVKASTGGTTLAAAYRVSGDSLHGLDKIAPLVDGVILEQLGRLKRFVETGKPD